MSLSELTEKLLGLAPWLGGAAGLALAGQVWSWTWLYRLHRSLGWIETELRSLRADLRKYQKRRRPR